MPDQVEFATKRRRSQTMLTRALRTGVLARWMAADEVYGADPGPRAERGAVLVGYVPNFGCDRRVPTPAGPTRLPPACPRARGRGCRPLPLSTVKGQRYYDWAWVRWAAQARHHRLLIRRLRHGELAFYHCNSLNPVRLDELVCVARRRWTIEESFLASKGLAGLDEHQVGRWLAWRRWTLLAMRVHALLAVITATDRAQHPPLRQLITMTCNEIRYLLTKVITDRPVD